MVEEEETLAQPARPVSKDASKRKERIVRRIRKFSDSGRRRDNWTEVQIRDSGGRRAGLADRVARVCGGCTGRNACATGGKAQDGVGAGVGSAHRQECLCYG